MSWTQVNAESMPKGLLFACWPIVSHFSCRKGQVGLQSRIGVACVQENGKFQSFRCSETEIELEISGEQLK